MKKYIKYIMVIVIIVGIFSPVFIMQVSAKDPTGSYELLAPLPGSDKTFNAGQGLSSYLNVMLRIFIGICAVLAMIMIILGGLEYMTNELISSKEAGKKKITGALFGLLLALGSYALLNTVNPDLLNSDVNIENSNNSSP